VRFEAWVGDNRNEKVVSIISVVIQYFLMINTMMNVN
jgi:hypothetical protein